ncbi:MAG: dihydrofolate reductase [Hyphococcus sp.]|nr:MAG: dihydrofolate reductase [Marinicaulis sp.]
MASDNSGNADIKIAIVVAAARNNAIGAGGDLAWRIKDDLAWFKKITMGKPIIMGRKTFQSIGKPLPGRDNIVITRAYDFAAEGVFITHNLEDALLLGRECAAKAGVDELAIIGGGEIYAQSLSHVDQIYLTRVDAEIEGDVFFPTLDSADWIETHVGACEKSQQNQFACEFVILKRRRKSDEKL